MAIKLLITEKWDQFNLLDISCFDISYDTELPTVVSKKDVVNRQVPKDISDCVLVDCGVYNHPLNDIIPTVRMTREHDITYLTRANRSGINTPDWIFTGQDVGSYLNLMEDGARYLIKCLYQARTLGQLVVDKATIAKLIYDSRNELLSDDEFVKKYKISETTSLKKARQTNEKYVLRNGLRTNRFYLSKIVDVKAEFRVLFFKEQLSAGSIIKRREGYGILTKDTPINYEISEKEADKLGLKKPMLEKLFQFFNSLEFPMASFDVYITKTGDWGIFEYCTQFGLYYSSDTLSLMKNLMTKAMEKASKEAIEKIKHS